MTETTFGRLVEIILASNQIPENPMIQAKWAAAEMIEEFEVSVKPPQPASVRDEM